MSASSSSATLMISALLLSVSQLYTADAFTVVAASPGLRCQARGAAPLFAVSSNDKNGKDNDDDNEWTSDFGDFVPGEQDSMDTDMSLLFPPSPESLSSSSSTPPPSPQPLTGDDVVAEDPTDANIDETTSTAALFTATKSQKDLTGTQSRLFSLGPDVILSDFVGNMGFDEVTDWEYYYANEEDPDDRRKVQPNPFDDSQPRRTRKKSGSVIRIFRGEFVGQIGGLMSARGMDRRVLIKEFAGEMAQQLARYERLSVGKLQSDLFSDVQDAVDGEWIRLSASRSTMARKDNGNVVDLAGRLRRAPFLGIYGEVDLAELEDEMDPNEFYRALSVTPPKPGAIWVVYEYAGLNSIASYCVPAEERRARIPPKKGFFGNVVQPPELPPFRQRADYVVKGIMKKCIEAVAMLHEDGIAHRSIGRSSFVITSVNQDKQETTNVYMTRRQPLVIKLADFGFSGKLEEAAFDEEFCVRARTFGFSFKRGEKSLDVTNFAMAEDLHALGFVFLGLLLSTLAVSPRPGYQMPATDEDTMQRLLADIFEKDIDQFREYVDADEAWDDLVQLLDENDGAGWTVLESLFLARERAVENKGSSKIMTARGLLSNPFFKE